MKKIFKIIFTIIAISVVVFLFFPQLVRIFFILENKYFPCSNPMTYSIGSFDERFNMSKEKFLLIVNTAESTWEKSIDKELFTYVPDGSGSLKINLIFDIRQEATQKLKDIGITVKETRASYNDLKERYTIMQADYLKSKTLFESKVLLFETRQDVYQEEVSYFNNSGGALKDDFNRLNKEKDFLDRKFIEINNLQKELNIKIGNINAIVIVLNRLASSLNIEVNKFNTIGKEITGEFEEGTYEQGPLGREINIYQFDTEGKLARVLTHEFGHAIGLEHLENPKAVMYRLNNGVNEKLAIEDIVALREYCGLSALIK